MSAGSPPVTSSGFEFGGVLPTSAIVVSSFPSVPFFPKRLLATYATAPTTSVAPIPIPTPAAPLMDEPELCTGSPDLGSDAGLVVSFPSVVPVPPPSPVAVSVEPSFSPDPDVVVVLGSVKTDVSIGL